ncbi:P2 phage tail completion R family protein [Yersinia pseudotuberculosis IP 32953]|uniref:P2 phage tail completion protein R n=4 Tax=Yersinia pseudotuberculosis complex TaxID=1649845 RepID=A0A380Q8R6_YERPU|nr:MULTISPECIES: phage tail protein [Yersinia pseudotuberculosis complex]CQD58947.1 P2 phage tail completion protein R [Yersinia intermedia]AIN15439.1 P2 phage tail completion R family protein [Yersinia pseudotuberculosis]AJJ01720.1 P2 phage tail completion R family protein [Yersinia pseudotuberculosis]AJJ56884.1 P2 phage tail completion R family protein [Yersinia pseudotuberculosis IP 32953]AJJ58355.1 P2 phage tail completion R family protein [Yersinia pseudotuberculosis YPIII]
MLKPDSLRTAILKAVPYIKQNPDCLHVFIDKGAIIATLAPSLSFEYQYTLNLVVTDYASDMDLVIVPVLHWLRTHQPDIMANPDKRQDSFTFEVDYLDNKVRDISIDIKLTERVIVKEKNGKLSVTHLGEPVPPEHFINSYQIDIEGKTVAEWVT